MDGEDLTKYRQIFEVLSQCEAEPMIYEIEENFTNAKRMLDSMESIDPTTFMEETRKEPRIH